MKIKFNSDDDLPLKKALESYNMILVVRTVLYEDNKYYPQFFLDEYDRFDVFDGTDVNKTFGLHEFIICHYWHFLQLNIRFQSKLCNCCHVLLQKATCVVTVSVEGNDYRIIIWYMSKNVWKKWNMIKYISLSYIKNE